MSFSQPPAQDTPLTGDWSPSLDSGSTLPTNETLEAEEHWILEALNNIPNDDFMVDDQPLASIDTDLALPYQEFFLDNDPFNTIQEQQNEAFNGFAPSTTDLSGTFQLDSMDHATENYQADSMADAIMPWASAPSGAGPSILLSASDLANTWVAPLNALEAHFSTNHLPNSGLCASDALARPVTAYMYANAPAGIDGPIPSCHEKRDGEYHCLMQPCPRPTFSRLADLQRHQNACHLGTAAFWCASTGCDRSQTHPYGRAFPRKDKRNDHEKKVHGRVLSVN